MKDHLFKDQKKVNDFILTHKHNPFPAPPASSDYLDNPAKFIIGRDNELELITSVLKESLDLPESKLMFLQGKQGIGKSTIVSSIPKHLKDINIHNKVMIVYFNTSNDEKDYHFLNFYKQTIKVLDDTNFLEKLVFATLNKILMLGIKSGGKVEQDLQNLSISQEYLNKIETDSHLLRSLLNNKIPILKSEIIKYIKSNYRILREYLNINFNFLLTIIECFIGDDAFNASNALHGFGVYEGFEINTDNDAISTFNDLKKLTKWIYGEVTFLIFFDHLERGLNHPTEVYQALFSLLHSIRTQKHTCIFISGTLDAFTTFYSILDEDRRLQIDNWLSFYETLRPLDPESVANIVKHLLGDFYKNSNFRPDYSYPLYPFGSESITYLYDNTNEDIRKTLIELHEKIKIFRKNQVVTPVITFFDSLLNFRQDRSLHLTPREITLFAQKLVDENIQDKNRSTQAEFALINLIKQVKNVNSAITDVKHEKPIGKKNLKPDVYIELFGRLTLSKVKKIGIEVKIYRVGKEVEKKYVEKTHSLIEKDLDYITWVTTVPLSRVKHELHQSLKEKVGRTAPLSTDQQAYLSLALYFEQIFKRQPDPREAEFVLNRIGLNIDDIIIDVTGKKPDKIKHEEIDTEKPEDGISKWIKDSPPIPPTPPPDIKIDPLIPPGKEEEQPPVDLNKIKSEQNKNKISEIIIELSRLGKTYANKATISKQLIKENGIKNITKDDEETIDLLITEIGKEKGLVVKPTRIYFKK